MSLNVAKLEKRLAELKERLESLRSNQPPPLLILTFSKALNKNAPSGTVASDADDGRPNYVALAPPGCKERPPQGVPTFAEWSRWSEFSRGDGNVQ